MNTVSNLNLLSFLNLISSQKIDDIQVIKNQFPSILEILEVLGLISVNSSNSMLKVDLTPLGSAILFNEDILNSLKSQDTKIDSITSDLQRIKSALSALSLDVIRTQNINPDDSFGSGLLSNKENKHENLSNSGINKQINNKSTIISPVSTTEDFKEYVVEKLQTMDQEQLRLQKKSIIRIKNTYARVLNSIQQNEYHEAGLEAFLVLDSIFIFLLQFFDQKDPSILSSPLEKKYNLLKELPLKIDFDVILFLDRFNIDIQNKTDNPLTIGEKTSKKILSLINDIYKPFISIFEVIS